MSKPIRTRRVTIRDSRRIMLVNSARSIWRRLPLLANTAITRHITILSRCEPASYAELFGNDHTGPVYEVRQEFAEVEPGTLLHRKPSADKQIESQPQCIDN